MFANTHRANYRDINAVQEKVDSLIVDDGRPRPMHVLTQKMGIVQRCCPALMWNGIKAFLSYTKIGSIWTALNPSVVHHHLLAVQARATLVLLVISTHNLTYDPRGRDTVSEQWCCPCSCAEQVTVGLVAASIRWMPRGLVFAKWLAVRLVGLRITVSLTLAAACHMLSAFRSIRLATPACPHV